MKKKFFRELLLLTLFFSLCFTGSLSVECQNVYPDEWLDLFGTTQSITPLKVIPKTQLAAFSDLIPGGNIFQRHYPRDLSLQPLISTPGLPVPLRC
jgi:hypothetical protein